MKYPDYGISEAISGFTSLIHWGAIMLALLFTILGIICVFVSLLLALLLFSLAVLILLIQIISRMRHMLKIRTVRPSRNSFYVFDIKTGKKFLPEDIRRVRKKSFEYADPWRPITLGYPGLEIELANVDYTIEDLYPWGLESLRDMMFTYLKENLSASVRFE